MNLKEFFLSELQQEIINTRKTLERIPAAKWNWKPHQKSWTMGELATHLANLPSWTNITIQNDSFDIAPPGTTPPKTKVARSLKEVLEVFDKNCMETRTTLENSSEEQLLKPWTMLHGGKTIFTMPKIAVLRSFILNHSIHHRAQLLVYFRLNDVPVPALYGPSADENGM